jgi:hypothetical protein
LRSLSLDGTSVTDAGLVELARLTALEHVHIDNTLVSDVGVGALRTALPNCRVRGRRRAP